MRDQSQGVVGKSDTLATSGSQHGANFEQIQGLREQNMQLKGRMA